MQTLHAEPVRKVSKDPAPPKLAPIVKVETKKEQERKLLAKEPERKPIVKEAERVPVAKEAVRPVEQVPVNPEQEKPLPKKEAKVTLFALIFIFKFNCNYEKS